MLPSPEPAKSRCLVLLLDPEPASRHLLAAALQHWGHTVSSEPSRLRQAGLVLLDPLAAGWPVLRDLRAAAPRVPLIAMLAGDDPLDRVLALESGADALIARPIELRELRARMLGLLQRRGELAQAAGASAPALSSGAGGSSRRRVACSARAASRRRWRRPSTACCAPSSSARTACCAARI